MAEHDYVIANQNGANTRSDLNNALAAIVSNNSKATEPTTTYAYMWWADTGNDLLKQRNAANSAWIDILTLSTGAPAGLVIGTDVQAYDADTAKTDVAQEYTSQQSFNATTLTFDATQDWNLATNQVCKVTLTANTTFDAPTNQVDGSVYVITIIQDGTGSRTAGWNTVFKWAGGTAPTLTEDASAKDVFTFVSDGTNMNNVAQVLDVK